MDLMQAALDYAAKGWAVFPCNASKEPYLKHGVLEASTDLEQVRSWWTRWPGANIGFSVGDARLLVLDYDPGSDKAALEEKLGEPLPSTKLVARTPRGGTHEYYSLNPGDDPVANSASTLGENIDVRSFHGYVLLPPSRTADGEYTWESEGKPAHRSDLLFQACKRAREKDPKRDEWLIEPDLEENIERAVEWLSNDAKIAIEGSGGDNTTYATAAMLKSFGISDVRAAELLWEHWNPRCLPPWEYEELAGKISNAYNYNTSPPGNVTPAYHAARVALEFKPQLKVVGEGGGEVECGRFRFVDRPGIEHIPPPRWLIPNFITEGSYNLLIGPRETFKTFVALDAALTVASGGVPAWEGEWNSIWDAPLEAGPVLYVAGEGRSGLKQRVAAWEQLHWGGELVDDFILGDPVPRVLDGADPLKQFIDGALEMRPQGYRLVVLDTIGRAMQGVNENAQEHASAFTALVEHIQRELGAAVLALHHTGHDNPDRGRGSSVFEADADTIVVTKRTGKLAGRLLMTKQKDAPGWDAPRYFENRVVKVGLRAESVATVRADGARAEEAEARQERQDKVSLEVVDQHTLRVLKANPRRELSDNKLATMVASWRNGDGDTLGITEQTIRKNWMPRLRVEGKCREYYDAVKGRWRYQPPPSGGE